MLRPFSVTRLMTSLLRLHFQGYSAATAGQMAASLRGRRGTPHRPLLASLLARDPPSSFSSLLCSPLPAASESLDVSCLSNQVRTQGGFLHVPACGVRGLPGSVVCCFQTGSCGRFLATVVEHVCCPAVVLDTRILSPAASHGSGTPLRFAQGPASLCRGQMRWRTSCRDV